MYTKCHVSDVDYPLTVKLLLFTKSYHPFRCTWIFSPSSNVHVAKHWKSKTFAKKVLILHS